MAKKSSIEKNNRRAKLVAQHAAKRSRLKAVAMDKSVPIEERFLATVKLAQLPRNGAKIRVRNRCELTGRPRGVYRKFKISRIALRDLGSTGQIPGVVKSSW
jgi:small subunit ribosomal protein S14